MKGSRYLLPALFVCSTMTAPGALVITEVMSNSDHPGGAANGDWFEITNTGGSSVDLTGYYWDDGDGFQVDGAQFPVSSIGAGESLVVVDENGGNLADFVAAWGGGFSALSTDDMLAPGAGTFNDFSGLGGGGDRVDLYDAGGTLVASAVFGDSDGGAKTFEWSTTGASLGFSVAGENGAFVAPGDGDGGLGIDVGSPGVAVVPEPSIAILGGLGLLGLLRRRR